ncbi:MAG: GIN domain-containing protein [Asticcacaulis sp.]
MTLKVITPIKMLAPVALVSALAMVPGLAQAEKTSSLASLKVKDAVVRLVVIPEDRTDFSYSLTKGSEAFPSLTVRQDGNRLIFDGGLKRKIRGCNNMRGNAGSMPIDPMKPDPDARITLRDGQDLKLSDAPLLVVRAPKSVAVSTSGASVVAVGRTQALEVNNAGCGAWTVANVEQRLEINQAGSGKIVAGNSASTEVSVAGSGDIYIADTKALEVSIAGSGDVSARSVEGPVEVSIAGSGDVRIQQGKISHLEVSIAGSGDIKAPRVVDLSVSIMGSGDVEVETIEGKRNVSIMGGGRINVRKD